MKTPYKITGKDAIQLAERDGLTIYCYANPIDDGGIVGINIARQIAKDDPSLIYVTVQPCGWWDGKQFVGTIDNYHVDDYFLGADLYLGPDVDQVEPRWSDA